MLQYRASRLIHTQLTRAYFLATAFASIECKTFQDLVPIPHIAADRTRTLSLLTSSLSEFCSCNTSRPPSQLRRHDLLEAKLLSHVRAPCTSPAFMRDRINRAKVSVAPGVLVQLMCITSRLPPQLYCRALFGGKLLSHIRMPCTNSAFMRDRLDRAKVSVAPGVLVHLIVAAAHDTSRDEVFHAAACCVASRLDGAHREILCCGAVP